MKYDKNAAIIIFCLVIAVIICIPLRVMSYGFLPPDDAMRHAAKVVSGKAWDRILVLRSEFTMDSHPGWHALLGAVYRALGCDQDTLVFFSVVFLFILFCMIPVFFLEFPEAWLAALLAFTVIAPHLIIRLFLGRPYIFTMSIILVLCFLWERLEEKKPPYNVMGILTVLIALSAWIHASWYLFTLPIACFFIAGRRRAAERLMLCAALGIIAGASLTAHPYIFLKQTLTHVVLALGNVSSRRLLVGEFQPFGGEPVVAIFILGMLLWRKVRGERAIANTTALAAELHDPVFVLAVAGWALGFVASRFWTDWGMPAAIFWVMAEIHRVFVKNMAPASWRRVFPAP